MRRDLAEQLGVKRQTRTLEGSKIRMLAIPSPSGESTMLESEDTVSMTMTRSRTTIIAMSLAESSASAIASEGPRSLDLSSYLETYASTIGRRTRRSG